jgi:hypothetical protein
LVNFNGGLRESDCASGDFALLDAAAVFGARTKIPSIWFYGDNDEFFPVSLWQGMADRYNRAGGHAELVDVGTVMKNSHNFLAYPEALSLWTPQIDSFLARIGMPSAVVDPHYMPVPFPPATQFASVTDVAAVPYLSDKGRDLYRKFLEAPFPRAFVISEGGSAASMNGGFDPLGRALASCRTGRARCGVYAVDGRVVWTPFPAVSREHTYSVSAKADQANMVDFSSRLNPDCSPRTFAKFHVVQLPQHGQVEIGQKSDFPRFAQTSPFSVCNKSPVQGVAVTYTPVKGFNGQDFFAFAEEGPAGLETVFRMTLVVK